MNFLDYNVMSETSGAGAVSDYLCGTEANLLLCMAGIVFAGPPMAAIGLGVAFGCYLRERIP